MMKLEGSDESEPTEPMEPVEPLLRVTFRDEGAAGRFREAAARALGALTGLRIERDPSGDLLAVESPRAPTPTDPMDDDMPLFIEDTAPADASDALPIPSYSRKFETLTAAKPVREEEKPKRSSCVECFNCGEAHTLKDCTLPKNFDKINQKRKEMTAKAVRYHAEECQEDEATPGHISKKLRKALGLRKHQLPLHIYKMRLLGYPPGWLQYAKVAHSGIIMFDERGKPVAEDGCHYGSKDEYDIEKIVEFPGFNIPVAGSKYTEEGHELGFPPYNEEHSKMTMVEKLAPRAAQAYRRRKMKDSTKPEIQPGDIPVQTDMDLENDDDEDNDNSSNGYNYHSAPPLPVEIPMPIILPPLPDTPQLPDENLSLSSIPMPSVGPPDLQSDETTEDAYSSQCGSPSLTELETQKLSIIAALENKESTLENGDISKVEYSSPEPCEIKENGNHSPQTSNGSSNPNTPICKSSSNNSLTSTPRLGQIRESKLGTPTYHLSRYSHLPDSTSFSKDIHDEILFENLPESTGKYEQMSGLIKKIRTEVSKLHQES